MTSHLHRIMDEQSHNSYSSKYLCKLLAQYRKPLLIILAAAAVMAVIFSSPFFITPLYKSTTIIYPTSSNSISKVLISTTYQSEKDIMNIGEDEQTEQMLQVLNSNRVRDKVISRTRSSPTAGIPSRGSTNFTMPESDSAARNTTQ